MAAEASQPQEQKITQAQTQEAIVRTTLNERTKASELGVQKRVDELSLKLAEQGPRRMMRSLVEDIDNVSVSKEVSDEKSKRVVENTFGWNTNEKGEKQLDEGEKVRLNDANERSAVVNDYLTKDYDKLTPDQKKHIFDDTMRMLRGVPAYNNVLEGLPDKGKSTIEGLLRNGEFKAQVKGVFERALNKAELNNENVRKSVVEANKDLQEANRERERKQKDLANIDNDIKNNNEALSKFKVAESEEEKGEKLKRIEQLAKEDKGNKSEIQKRQTAITDIDKQIDDLRLEQAGASDVIGVDKELEIQSLLEKRGILEKEKSEFAAKRKELKELKKEENDLRKKAEKLDQDRDTKSKEYDAAKLLELVKSEAFDLVSGEKVKYEQGFINEINNTFADSTLGYIREKVIAAEGADRQLKDEVVEADEVKKNFKDALMSRWVKDAKRKEGKWLGFREERDTIIANKRQVAEDFSSILKEGGPSGIMKDILMTNCGMSLYGADTKLKDQAFVKEMGDKVTDQVISRKFQTGQITGDEVMQIVNSEMGAEAMNRAIAKNKEAAKVLGEMSKEGVLKGSTPAEWARQIKESNSKTKDSAMTLLLSIIFGVPLAAIFAAKELGKTFNGL